VGILDTFTASIDNLKEQIAQRRKQYEYYRCRLLSTKKWTENKIGELTKVFTCPRVFKDQWQDSGVPFWRSSDIMSYHNGIINPRGEVFISQSLYDELSSKSDIIKEGDILVTGGGSIGIPYLKKDNSPLFVKDADLICIQKCSSIVPKYLYHYFLSTDFKLYLKKITHDATIAHYTINQIKDTPIPLPSLQEQQRIVSILDTFEDSIQNLEAQLEQRQKQYEYYRNKLLTFE
jgi:type I restriction enzyme S subunit